MQKKVRTGIIKIIDNLIHHPEKYPRDKFKKANSGNYRAFERYSYRVIYNITEKEIRILRFRHVKQEPKEY
ncbi:MAG TPA: type II toxin-antitoxin system RelE/ParE family toxin [Cyclobacteriaceae bacterium]|nr:type II toxin-antitoxin system RelE/ParE family toxin [Cyclobacteriaceae bacterium]